MFYCLTTPCAGFLNDTYGESSAFGASGLLRAGGLRRPRAPRFWNPSGPGALNPRTVNRPLLHRLAHGVSTEFETSEFELLRAIVLNGIHHCSSMRKRTFENDLSAFVDMMKKNERGSDGNTGIIHL